LNECRPPIRNEKPAFSLELTMRRLTSAAALLATLCLTACGGNDNDSDGGSGMAPTPTPTPTPAPTPTPTPTPTPSPTPQRGDLLENPPSQVGSFAPQDLLNIAGQNDVGKTLLQWVASPKCSVIVHQLKYQTVGATEESTSASGALMLPSGTDPACQGARPVLLYAHGTSTERAFNIASLSSSNPEGLAIALEFAAQGYIVVAPNYAGYDSSSLTYHPFLNADQQSKDMIDALKAARSALPVSTAATITDNGKLFVTGYSQGGYVAMATHRAMQAAGTTVTAAAPMSGPYALSAFGDAIFEGQIPISAPVNLTMLISSYDVAYGDIFANTTDVFEAKYATGINTLLPSTTGLTDLESQGKITSKVVFSNTPPDATFASLTPATSPPELASVFAQGFGPDNLITNAYRLSYLQDAQTAPDGAFPTKTDGLPPANPTQALRRALKANDLRNWAPNAPVLLCAGSQDPTVFYLNTQAMQDYWAASAPGASVTVVNMDSAPAANDPYTDLKNGFQAAKDLVRTTAVVGGASDNGDQAVFDAYHAGLLPPFCFGAVKSFFDSK
jgi:pimeloyl-ACP methyl ester carboxylesterase